MVVFLCNSNYSGGGDLKELVLRPAPAQTYKTPCAQTNWMWWVPPLISVM
jgi:hypothetical protein